MPVDPKDRAELIAEALDSERVTLTCGEHGYIAGSFQSRPMPGCVNCNKVFLIHLLTTHPPAKRAEKLEELTRAIVDACALEDRGKFDFQAFEHPKIEIAKG